MIGEDSGSSACPQCGELVEYNQFKGHRANGQLWHSKCWAEKQGFSLVEDSEDRPWCSNCNGAFDYRREGDEFPMPDADGEIAEFFCTTFHDQMTRVTCDTSVREFTQEDWDFLESVVGTDHWFSEMAARIHPDKEGANE